MHVSKNLKIQNYESGKGLEFGNSFGGLETFPVLRKVEKFVLEI